MKRKILFLFLTFLFINLFSFSQPETFHSGEIQLALKKLNTVGSVLYIAAHPDDENTRLLSYLGNEKLLRTAYLSITRGDGGQNLIGTEQSELLGVIRAQELLAARKVDGAEQFFTRANDFGYSKTPEETLEIWGKEDILSDMVWIIRKFRPDLIITRFPSTGEGGHGHHTASAILAMEAFDAAADPNRFSQQLKFVEPWQAKRLVWNSFIRNKESNPDLSAFLKMDIGDYNSLLGKSYGEMAADSRSMHKSQGFGAAKVRGPILEYFKHQKGDSASTDIFQGLNFTWTRLPETEKLSALLNDAYLKFNAEKPEDLVPHLLNAYAELKKLKNEYWKEQKKKELEELILACSGLWFEAYASEYSVVPGNEIKVTASLVLRNSNAITLEQIKFPGNADTSISKKLNYNELLNIEKNITVPQQIPFSNPYWLGQKPLKGTFIVNDQTMIGVPENKSAVNVDFVFSINQQRFTFTRPVMYKWVDPVDGEKYRILEIIPALTLNINKDVFLFTNTVSKPLKIMLKAGKPDVTGTVNLKLAPGWKSEPSSANFNLKTKGEERAIVFNVSPAKKEDTAVSNWGMIKAEAQIENNTFSRSIERIEYDHIAIQTLLPEAEAKLVSIDLKMKGKKIGYIPGADEIPPLLEQIGYEVTLLNDELLSADSLDKFDAIITGIRAYNTNERLIHHYDKLMRYVESGGTMIVQYNTNNFLGTVKSEMGPYPFKISRERVTVEEAPVLFDNPDHPVLNSPNKITKADFDGWVQERGLYFASDWDPHYETVFSMNDPGEKEQKGSLIISKHGEGFFMYTGLSFFRELPAGVPGAYRLFVNMISYGK